jgi:hypothetical protein
MEAAMKMIVAACVAITTLYIADLVLSGGYYSSALQRIFMQLRP